MVLRRRLLLDTNIVIDYCDASRPEHIPARKLIESCVEAGIELVASVSSLKDVYYILRRLYQSEPLARTVVRKLVEGPLTLVDLRAAYALPALDSDEPDFEDALVRVSAETEGVDAIITRDDAAFAGSLVPHMNASAYLERFAG